VTSAPDLAEAIVSVGLSKNGVTIEAGIPCYKRWSIAHAMPPPGQRRARHGLCRVRRFDAYIEQGISLWDVAAGWILVETAGGSVEMKPRRDMPDRYSIIASQRRGRFETVSAFRCGIGYDAHRLVSGRKLILGGVKIPHPRGLEDIR